MPWSSFVHGLQACALCITVTHAVACCAVLQRLAGAPLAQRVRARCVYRWGPSTHTICVLRGRPLQQTVPHVQGYRLPLAQLLGRTLILAVSLTHNRSFCPTPYDVQRRTKLCAVVVEADAEWAWPQQERASKAAAPQLDVMDRFIMCKAIQSLRSRTSKNLSRSL
jgi:hypothetical protein